MTGLSRSGRVLALFALLVPASLSAQAQLPGQTAESGSGQVGRRQTTLPNPVATDPTGRLDTRISNRVQTRLGNRIDRYFNPQAFGTAAFGTAANSARKSSTRPRPRRR